MSEETSSSGPIPPFVAETKRILEPIIKKPKLLIDEKLARPPFQYIFQLFATIVQTTGFGQDVFTEEDLTFDKEKFSSKEAKLAFLNRIVEYVAAQSGTPAVVNPKKIVAGAEVEITNQFLQLLGKTADAKKTKTGKSSDTKPKESKDSSEKKSDKADKKEKKEKKSDKKKEDPPKEKKEDPPKEKKEDPPKEKKEKQVATPSATKPKPSDSKTKSKEPEKKSSIPKPSASKAATNAKDPKGKSPTPSRIGKPSTTTTTKKGATTDTKKASTVQEAEKPEPAVEEEPEAQKTQAPAEDLEKLIKQSARPQTARPAPPRIQSNVRTVEKVVVESSAPTVNPQIVLEDGEGEEEEEPAALEDDDDTNREAVASSEQTAANSTADEPHGGLVRDIIAATKTLEQPSANATGEVQQNKQKTEALTLKHNKEVLQKEVNTLQESIQTICRSANPLGKTMDYVQEDFENMTKELEKWRQESGTQQLKVEEEKRLTEQTLTPLYDKLSELDQAMREALLKINAAKGSVEKNDDTITKMLRLVVKQA